MEIVFLALFGAIMLLALLASLKNRRRQKERAQEIAREREELRQRIAKKHQSVRIDKLVAPPGGSASVEVRNGKVTVKTSGPGAEVRGVYSNGNQDIQIGLPDPSPDMTVSQLAIMSMINDSLNDSPAPTPEPTFSEPVHHDPTPAPDCTNYSSGGSFDNVTSCEPSHSSFDSGGSYDSGSSFDSSSSYDSGSSFDSGSSGSFD
jgi:hypothetical protein